MLFDEIHFAMAPRCQQAHEFVEFIVLAACRRSQYQGQQAHAEVAPVHESGLSAGSRQKSKKLNQLKGSLRQ